MSGRALMLSLGLLSLVALAHPHPRRIIQGGPIVQDANLLKVGVLDAGTVTAASGYFAELHFGTADGGTMVIGLDGIVLKDSSAWVSSGPPGWAAGMYFPQPDDLRLFADDQVVITSGGIMQLDADGFELTLSGDPVSVVDSYFHIYSSAVGTCSGSFPHAEGSIVLLNPANPVRTALCLCTHDGSAYRWANLTTGAIGDTTTCPTDDVTIGLWSAGDGSGPAQEDINLGPAFPVGAHPPKFGTISVQWGAAGTGGTNGVQAVIYEHPSGPELCSCFVSPCSGSADYPRTCECATRALANKVYTARVGGLTDCGSNPSDVHIGVQLLR